MRRATYKGVLAAALCVSPGAAADPTTATGTDAITLASAPSPVVPLDDVLAHLSDNHGYSFVFDSRLTEEKAIGDIRFEPRPEAALARELHSVDLTLKRINRRTFAIRPAPSSSSSPEATGAPPPPASEDGPALILVTGARLANPNATASSPVLVVDSSDFENSGHVTAEHHLNTLPHFIGDYSSQSNNPGINGRALVNLRGLGSHRNLVLIDGRRAIPSSGAGEVDINIIPAAIIDRAEILTGGATAAYGTDAVTGVVNFILDRDFQGLSLDGQYGVTQRGDGDEYTIGAKLGRSFAGGQGKFLLALAYFNRAHIAGPARPFSADSGDGSPFLPEGAWISGVNPPSQEAVDAYLGVAGYPVSGGSSGWSFNLDGSPFGTGLFNNRAINVAGMTGPADYAAGSFPDAYAYDFRRDNTLVLPLERTSAFVNMDFEIGPRLKPYASLLLTNYDSERQLAPTPAPGAINPFSSMSSSGFSVPVTNPFIHPELAALLASRADPDADFAITKRTNFLGTRRGEDSHLAWQAVIGANGEISGSWNYDAYLSYGRSRLNERQAGNVILRNMQALLDEPDGGASICAGGFNPFGLSAVSEECAAFIRADAEHHTALAQTAAEITAAGELAPLPAGALRAAVGASFRSVDFTFTPDPLLSQEIITGLANPKAVTGVQRWADMFAEVNAPLLSDRRFVKSLALTAGWRYSHASLSGGAHSWTASGGWEIDDRLRLRGGYQRALRSPSSMELFTPENESFPNLAGNDPCNTSQSSPSFLAMFRRGPDGDSLAALCAAQSSVAGRDDYNQPNGQIHVLGSGSTDLQPELSNTLTGGFLVNLGGRSGESPTTSIAIDYWNIRLRNAIASASPAEILHYCYNFAGANPTFDPQNDWCRMFERDPLAGGVLNLRQTPQNQGMMDYAGLDISLKWGIDLDRLPLVAGGYPGSLDLSLVGTWLIRAEERRTPFSPINDRAGTIGQATGTAYPEFSALFTATYSRDNLLLRSNVRYIDAMRHSLVDGSGVGATWYLDLSASYVVSSGATVRAGVNNLLDQAPRLYEPHVQSGTDPSTYDVLGRRFFVGVNVRL